MITVWTVGHSTRSGEEFREILSAHGVQVLVDVRSFPGSRRYPQFNRAALAESLHEAGIEYRHEPRLGGRPKPRVDSEEFRKGVKGLLEVAENTRTAIMCAEALWSRCHRRLISDYLKAEGHTVIHILAQNKTEEHPVTLFSHGLDGSETR